MALSESQGHTNWNYLVDFSRTYDHTKFETNQFASVLTRASDEGILREAKLIDSSSFTVVCPKKI